MKIVMCVVYASLMAGVLLALGAPEWEAFGISQILVWLAYENLK